MIGTKNIRYIYWQFLWSGCVLFSQEHESLAIHHSGTDTDHKNSKPQKQHGRSRQEDNGEHMSWSKKPDEIQKGEACRASKASAKKGATRHDVTTIHPSNDRHLLALGTRNVLIYPASKLTRMIVCGLAIYPSKHRTGSNASSTRTWRQYWRTMISNLRQTAALRGVPI